MYGPERMTYRMRPLRPTLLAAASTAPLLGCTAKPTGTPIVLHPPHAVRHVAQREKEPQHKAVVTASPAAASPASLSPAQKENLFRGFDAYLNQSGSD